METKTPIIIVNFKAYSESTGPRALALGRILAQVARAARMQVIAAVQASDISLVHGKAEVPVYAQHIDALMPGAHTGATLAEAVKAAGASGTLINHSEKRQKLAAIRAAVDRARELGLVSVVCADSPGTASRVARFSPDFIAIEPPELIGGDISVSVAKPEIITHTIDKVRNVADIPIICGAGIKNQNDVRIAAKLGVIGILVASGVVKAADPMKELLSMAKGFVSK